ncbi:hypothetical protein CK203_050257 [Vitis vinifera]|uniref:Uncharacterized protein n=1 Tax=Vitis vinifera TaxID=29760 RepID=A0A438GZ67_VITVI|nr:hypothetical protein CK203_050257 [Vitis vinifera]
MGGKVTSSREITIVKANLKEWNKYHRGDLLYFEKLYASPTGESWSVEGLDWSPVSKEIASRLDSSFIEEEISKAIFQLDKDKASGPNGFTIAVFQDCWDVIKDDLGSKRVLHETIHSTQGTFVQGRQILDVVLIVNEIVDEKRRSGEEGVVFKIDFEKAYDHVSWDFLDHVLEKKGFSLRWRKWMSGCLSTVSYAVLVNRTLKGGSRLLEAKDKATLYLLFCLLSRRCIEEEELQTLKSLLLVFRHISSSRLLVAYTLFGSSLGGNPKACGFWDLVIERISRRLDGWQKAYLSFGGRITLIQSCLTHVPCYFLSSFKISASMVAKIERLQRDFYGQGLGRYPKEGSALWHQVILSIYGSHSNGWDANTIVRWSHCCPWKAITQVFQKFSKFTRFVVGDGERIRFWEDLWLGDQL